MRWPWRPAPGMVRVSRRRMIELQRRALRVVDLEREAALIAAETRAIKLIAEREAELGASLALPAELPLTAGGRLHEGAFLALVEAQAWERHEDALRRLLEERRGGWST